MKLLDQNEAKFNATLEAAGLTKLSSVESKFLREFVWVMAPVAQGLDILQRNKDMYAGYLIPTALSIERQLLARRTMDGKPLKYCEVLARTLAAALRDPKRFGSYLEDRDLAIAAVLLPAFKMDWIFDINREADIKAAILEEMAVEDSLVEENLRAGK